MNSHAPPTSGSRPSITRRNKRSAIDPVVWGTICGLVSAVGYTAANVFLRSVSHVDPVWVSCVKAVPTTLLIGPWLLVITLRGAKLVPSLKAFAAVLVSGAIGQFGGNVSFQWALGVIGMALTVPLTMGSIIVTGAFMGRFLLSETVTVRMSVAMAVLIAAISVLSLGAGEANKSVAGADSSAAKKDDASESAAAESDGATRLLLLAAGVGAACFAGFAYSLLGVAIRYAASLKMPQSATLVTVSVTGILLLGAATLARSDVSELVQTSPRDLTMMFLAGVANAVAFATLTKALQLTSVVYVNALGASQVAMAALAGVLIFNEALSLAMAAGVVMTAVGLIIMRRKKR